LLLLLEVAIADVCQAQQTVVALAENFRYRAAHVSEAHQSYAARDRVIP
jgi:hypothetical protein